MGRYINTGFLSSCSRSSLLQCYGWGGAGEGVVWSQLSRLGL
jgi:hypothetical protein